MKHIQFALIAALTLFGSSLFAAEKTKTMDATQLAKLAETADSAAEHATVAREYRLRAEEHTRTAEKYEAKVAAKQGGPQIGMAAKWPSMSRNSVQSEKAKAVEARRMAREASELASLHTQLAVEKGFGGTVEAKNLAPNGTQVATRDR